MTVPEPPERLIVFALTYGPALFVGACLLGYVILPYFFPWWRYDLR